MFAETGEMFLHLDFKFGEGGFADGGEMFAFVCGVERARRKNEIQGEAEFLGSWDHGKNTMKLNEIGIKTFQELVYFIRAPLQSFFSRSVTFYFFEKDGKFHVCTCGNLPGMGEQTEL